MPQPEQRLSSFDRALDRIALLAVRHPARVLLGVLLALGLGLTGMLQLRIDANLEALLPEDASSVRGLNRVRAQIGTLQDLLVSIESPSRAANIAFGEALSARLRQESDLRYVIFRRDVAFFRERALLYLPLDELLSLRRRVIRRIRREVARRVVVQLDDEEESGEDDSLQFDYDALVERYFGGLKAPGEYLEADDGRIVVIKARPDAPTTNVDFTLRLVRRVERLIEELEPARFHPQLRAIVAGEYADRSGEMSSIGSEVVASAVFAALALMLIIGVAFRSVRAVAVVLLPVIIATVITLGVGVAIYQTFNLVTAFIFAVLLGLGVDFSIHLLARYRFERAAGHDNPFALARTLRLTGRPVVTGAATTACVFLLLSLGRFQGFAQFGVVAGIGVVLALGSALLLVPALVTLAERFSPWKVPRRKAGGEEEGLSWLARTADRHRGATRVAAALVVGASVAAFALPLVVRDEISFEYDFKKLGPTTPRSGIRSQATGPDYRDAVGRVTSFGPMVAFCERSEQCAALTRLLQAIMRLDERELAIVFGGESPAAAVSAVADAQDDDVELVEGPFAALEREFAGSKLSAGQGEQLRLLGRRRAEQMHHFLRGFLSLQLFVPERQRDKLRVIADIRRRVDRKRGALSAESQKQIDRWYEQLSVSEPVRLQELPAWVTAQFTDRHGAAGRFAILWNGGSKTDYRTAKQLHEAFFALPLRDGAATLDSAASYFVLVEVIDALKADAPVVIGAAGGAVFLALLLLQRSLGAVFLSLIPLVLATGWLAGLFWAVSWKFNMFSVIAFPLLVGMAIDDAVHILGRWRESRSVGEVLREVGGPVTLTTVTTLVGFAGLLFAGHLGVRSLGVTAALGMLFALISSVITLTAILALSKRGGGGV